MISYYIHDTSLTKRYKFVNNFTTEPKIIENKIKYLLDNNYKFINDKDISNNIISEDNKTVHISFDDGYKSNLEFINYVTYKYKIPVSLYINVSFILNQKFPHEFILSNIFSSNSLPNSINHFNIQNFDNLSACYNEICNYLKFLAPDARDNFMNNIKNVEHFTDYNIFLDKNDLLKISKNPYITIGSHSYNHVPLSIYSHKDYGVIFSEISESKNILEDIINKEIISFSFPYGCYNDDIIFALKSFGYKVSFTTNHLSEKFKNYIISRESIQ